MREVYAPEAGRKCRRAGKRTKAIEEADSNAFVEPLPPRLREMAKKEKKKEKKRKKRAQTEADGEGGEGFVAC
jgi:hypothetical protein